MELDQLWQLTLGEMEVQLSRASFLTWLKNSKLLERKEGSFCVGLPNNFARAYVEDKYQKNLLGIMRSFDETVKKLEFVVIPQKEPVEKRSIKDLFISLN